MKIKNVGIRMGNFPVAKFDKVVVNLSLPGGEAAEQ